MITTLARENFLPIPSRAMPELRALKNLNAEVLEISHEQLTIQNSQPGYFSELPQALPWMICY